VYHYYYFFGGIFLKKPFQLLFAAVFAFGAGFYNIEIEDIFINNGNYFGSLIDLF